MPLQPECQTPAEGRFANYAIPFSDPLNVDHDGLGRGLRKALYNFMHGIGLKEDVRTWFEVDVPKTQSAASCENRFDLSETDSNRMPVDSPRGRGSISAILICRLEVRPNIEASSA